MTDVPDQAVEAAYKAYNEFYGRHGKPSLLAALQAAAPFMQAEEFISMNQQEKDVLMAKLISVNAKLEAAGTFADGIEAAAAKAKQRHAYNLEAEIRALKPPGQA